MGIYATRARRRPDQPWIRVSNNQWQSSVRKTPAKEVLRNGTRTLERWWRRPKKGKNNSRCLAEHFSRLFCCFLPGYASTVSVMALIWPMAILEHPLFRL